MPKSDFVKTVNRCIEILTLPAEDGRHVGVIELSVSGSVFQRPQEDTGQLARLLQDGAYELSGRLGCLV